MYGSAGGMVCLNQYRSRKQLKEVVKMGDKDATMSEYERDRLKRIEENRKMLDELFPDGTSLNVNGSPAVQGGRRDEEHTSEGEWSGGSVSSSPASTSIRTR